MKLFNDDVPLCKLRSFVKSLLVKGGLFALVGVAILPANLAVAEPAAQPLGSEILANLSSVLSTTDLYQKPVEKMTVTATAYNSHEDQTDSTPCVAARGYDLCSANQENVVAANFLPIGTKILVPELYGDQIFTVVDRMNSRYSRFCFGTSCRIDFWKRSYSDARSFGKQVVEIQIIARPEQ